MIFTLFCSNSELFSLPRNGSERNSKVCFYFYSTERNWNFELISLPRNDSKRNSESSFLFLFRGTAGIPPKQTNRSVCYVFRGIILSDIANPNHIEHFYSAFLLESFSCLLHGNVQCSAASAICLALLTPLKAIYLGQASGPDICFVKNKYYPFHNIHMQIYFLPFVKHKQS